MKSRCGAGSLKIIPFQILVVIGQTERVRVITRSLHLLLVGLGELWRRRWSPAVPLHGHRPDPAPRPLCHCLLRELVVGGSGLPIQINHPLNIKPCNAPTHHRCMARLAEMGINMKKSPTIVKSVISQRRATKYWKPGVPNTLDSDKGPGAFGALDKRGSINYN